MRTLYLLLILASLFAGTSLLQSADPGQPPPRRFALLIGPDRYDSPQLGPLKYCGDDVRRLAELLHEQGWQVETLTDNTQTRPTRQAILQRLKKTANDLRKEDLFLVGWFGHGVQFETGGPYCVPADGKPSPDQCATLVGVSEMLEVLDRSFGQHLLLLDVSRNNPGVRGMRAGGDLTMSRGMSCLLSCSAGENCHEDDRLRAGIFAHVLHQGLRGKAANPRGRVTWLSLAQYALHEVPATTKKLYPDRRQTPQLLGNLASDPVLMEFPGR